MGLPPKACASDGDPHSVYDMARATNTLEHWARIVESERTGKLHMWSDCFR